MNDWKIQGRSRQCQGCQTPFADKQGYHTLLFEQRSGFERLDVCERCWEEQHRHGAADRKGFISHWQGVFMAPPPPAPEAIQKDSAETLLRRLVALNDPGRQSAAFILAAMLERKRTLKARETVRQNGRRVFVYEHPRTGEAFTVVDPELRLDQLEAVQREVAELLERGLPDPDADSEGAEPSARTEEQAGLDAAPEDGMESEAAVAVEAKAEDAASDPDPAKAQGEPALASTAES